MTRHRPQAAIDAILEYPAVAFRKVIIRNGHPKKLPELITRGNYGSVAEAVIDRHGRTGDTPHFRQIMCFVLVCVPTLTNKPDEMAVFMRRLGLRPANDKETIRLGADYQVGDPTVKAICSLERDQTNSPKGEELLLAIKQTTECFRELGFFTTDQLPHSSWFTALPYAD